MQPPLEPKIYHIVHIDNLQSILERGGLLSDAEVRRQNIAGTGIGDPDIKGVRLTRRLLSHDGLTVGECVPFYFCPRSVLLFLNYTGSNLNVPNRGGQSRIIHLEADLHQAIAWAGQEEKRWAFTTSNAATRAANDYSDLRHLDKIDWGVVQSKRWAGRGDVKMAEFLVEESFPWHLFRRIGVHNEGVADRVSAILAGNLNNPVVEIRRGWYY